ncbi:MAG: potassium channel family protein [Candidatus Woesearchaeota archaeon]
MNQEEHKKFRRKMFFVFLVMLFWFLGGSLFYHKIENWKWIDSFYFAATTMTTVGYGDFHPQTDLGKIFSIFYLFSAVGIALYGLTMFTTHFVEVREEKWLNDFRETIQKTKNVKKVLEDFLSIKNTEQDNITNKKE